jgi:hypothetical protein
MGDQVSGVQAACSTKGLLHFVPGESMSWDTLRDYKMIIHSSASSPKNQIVGLLKYAGDLLNFFESKKRMYSRYPTSALWMEAWIELELRNLGGLSSRSQRM